MTTLLRTILHFFLFASSLFLLSLFASCLIVRLPKTISLQVGRKLADKTKDEIMTEVLRVSASLDVMAFQVTYEVVRVTFRSTFGRPNRFRESIFSVFGALS